MLHPDIISVISDQFCLSSLESTTDKQIYFPVGYRIIRPFNISLSQTFQSIESYP